MPAGPGTVIALFTPNEEFWGTGDPGARLFRADLARRDEDRARRIDPTEAYTEELLRRRLPWGHVRQLTPAQEEQLADHPSFERETRTARKAGDLAGAVAAAQKVLANNRTVFVTGRYVAEALTTLAELHEARGDFAAARKARQEILAVVLEFHAPRHWLTLQARCELAAVEQADGLEGAERARLVKAAQLGESVRGLLDEEQFGRALQAARSALVASQEVLGEKHLFTLRAMSRLGKVYLAKGDDDRAEPLYRRVADTQQKVLGPDHPEFARALNDLASLHWDRGEQSQAGALWQRAHEIEKRAGLEPRTAPKEMTEPKRTNVGKVPASDHAGSLHALANRYALQGDYPRAESLYRQALELGKKAGGEKQAPTRPS